MEPESSRIRSAELVLPCAHLTDTLAFFTERLGFRSLFEYGPYAGVGRGAVELHLDGAAGAATPVTARIAVAGIDELYAEMQKQDVIHPEEPLATQPWGMRQFSILDPDRNRITFAQPAEQS